MSSILSSVAPSREVPASKDVIRLTNLRIAYSSGVEAVGGVDLSIREGEFVSLIGPSGCGKSTIANAIARLLEPSYATVEGKIDLAANRLGYVFQRDLLLPWRTARENVEVGLEIRGVPASTRRAVANRLLKEFRLDGFSEAYPHQLSGGMRQRVALARTLAYNPDVILMDEPFGALDAQTRVLLQSEFLRISAQERKTVVLITHDLAEAITMSDRIVVLSHRPSRVQAIYSVDLPGRSDALALRNHPRFLSLFSEIWEVLSTEVRQQHAN